MKTDALAAGNLAALKRVRGRRSFGRDDAVREINSAGDNGGAGVARADGCAPSDLRTAGGKFFEYAALAPDAVALRAEPLGPVIGAREVEADDKREEESD